MTIDLINLLPKKQYTSGTESTMFDQKIQMQLTNGDELTTTLGNLTFGELPDLSEKLADKTLFDTLIDVSKLKKSTLMGLYKNEDDIRAYFDVLRSKTHQAFYLLIFSYGETQPSKYALQLESVWPLAD